MTADDRPRYLARMSGYTTDPGAAVDKLEAVSEDEQQRQTALAHRRAGERRRDTWGGLRGDLLEIAGEVGRLLGSDGLEAACTIRRTVDRLDRAANR